MKLMYDILSVINHLMLRNEKLILQKPKSVCDFAFLGQFTPRVPPGHLQKSRKKPKIQGLQKDKISFKFKISFNISFIFCPS